MAHIKHTIYSYIIIALGSLYSTFGYAQQQDVSATSFDGLFPAKGKGAGEYLFEMANPSTKSERTIYKQPDIAPRFMLAANAGYSWRIAGIDGKVAGGSQPFYDKLKWGFTWDASAAYFFNDTYGFNLSFQNFSSSNSELMQLDELGTGTLNVSDRISYAGSAIIMRYVTDNQKWVFDGSVGLGYMYWQENASFDNKKGSAWGSTFGTQASAGIEYKLSPVVGIGTSARLTYGSIGTINTEGVRELVGGSRVGVKENLLQLTLVAGIRIHIN